jgi:dienelactone hydrolase
LASHGYVVASFDAAYRSGDVVLPDGRVIARVPQNDMDEVSPSEFEHLANRLAEAGSADTSFALDELERLNAADPSGKFVGRLDMQRVGAFGHSLRGAVALQFCHDDARCKACIDVDGLPWGSAAREGIAQPLLLLMSDHAADPDDQEARLAKANFGSLIRLSGDRWLKITIRGAGHYTFSDDAILRSPLLMRALHTFGLVGIDGHRQIAVTEHYMGAFFDVYLKGSPPSELNAQPEYPEVEYAH